MRAFWCALRWRARARAHASQLPRRQYNIAKSCDERGTENVNVNVNCRNSVQRSIITVVSNLNCVNRMKLKNRFGEQREKMMVKQHRRWKEQRRNVALKWSVSDFVCGYESSFIGNLVRTNWCAAVQRITIDGIKKDETTYKMGAKWKTENRPQTNESNEWASAVARTCTRREHWAP